MEVLCSSYSTLCVACDSPSFGVHLPGPCAAVTRSHADQTPKRPHTGGNQPHATTPHTRTHATHQTRTTRDTTKQSSLLETRLDS